MSKIKLDPRLIGDVLLLLGASFSAYYMLNYVANQLSASPADETKGGEAARRRANAVLARLQAARPALLTGGGGNHGGAESGPGGAVEFDRYELTILANVVMPDEIKVGFKDIGGLEGIVEELRESVLYPLTCPELYNYHSTLLKAPKGVLLYGPPGCGKTMLAKAIAAESSAIFINIRMSTIMDKWFGESNKLVAAIFSVARKLQPCIVFIDEIDSFLRARQSSDHEVTANLKTEFMTLWDGLTSDGQVMVLGATNRPNDIDDAILRRMPKRFPVPLPNKTQRRRILEITLKDARLDPAFDMEQVVTATAGMSGSDISEACRNAAWAATRETIRRNIARRERRAARQLRRRDNDEASDAASDDDEASDAEVERGRPIRTQDFFVKTAAESGLPRNIVAEVPAPVDDDETNLNDSHSTPEPTSSRPGPPAAPASVLAPPRKGQIVYIDGTKYILDENGQPCQMCSTLDDFQAFKSLGAPKGAFPASAKTSSAAPPASTPSVASAASVATAASLGPPPDVQELGRASWTFLHSLAATYPGAPTAQEQTQMRTFLAIFANVYPCWYCAQDLREWMAAHQPRVASRDELGLWMCDAHNAVNDKLGKPLFDCRLWKQRWIRGWSKKE